MLYPFKAVSTYFLSYLRCFYHIYNDLHQFININETYFTIIENGGFFTMSNFMTKGCHKRIVIWFSKGTKNIGNGQGSEISAPCCCPCLITVLPSFFDLPIMVVFFFLRGGRKQNMWSNFLLVQAFIKLCQPDSTVGFVNNFRIFMPVHGSKMYNNIALGYKVLQ